MQMGQHSPKGTSGLRQSLSSQIMSSQRTLPVSHTQMLQVVGFHTSLSLYVCPSCKQLPASSVPSGREWPSASAGREQRQGERKEVAINLTSFRRC